MGKGAGKAANKERAEVEADRALRVIKGRLLIVFG